MLRLPEVCRVVGLSRSMIYLLESQERFPQRVKLGTRAVGWLESEVQAWLASRLYGSRTQQTAERGAVRDPSAVLHGTGGVSLAGTYQFSASDSTFSPQRNRTRR
jgi:prophage regulatory protein